jgi:hypothetical protein
MQKEEGKLVSSFHSDNTYGSQMEKDMTLKKFRNKGEI